MYAVSMTNRAALRAALVVSGLGLTAGCGGTASLRDPDPTPASSSNEGSHEGAAVSACDPSIEPTTEVCCNQQGARQWDASSGTCLWTAVPGPFVPPAMIG